MPIITMPSLSSRDVLMSIISTPSLSYLLMSIIIMPSLSSRDVLMSIISMPSLSSRDI